ncbi:ParA family protein [Microbacterium sp.]|uniref:ParA family protein n=1 Tax=Microbacterium sp. TaxID=51671 RepID=UPI003734F3F4
MSTGSEAARVHAHVTGDTAHLTSADNTEHTLTAADGDALRAQILQRVRSDAAAAGLTLELHTTGDRGEHELLVGPDGELIAVGDDVSATRAERRQRAWWTTDLPPASDPGDDDDLEEDTFTARISVTRTAAVPTMPEFFLPAPAAAAKEAADEPVEEAAEEEAPADAAPEQDAPLVTEIPSDGPVGVARASLDADADLTADDREVPPAPIAPVAASPMASGIGDSLPEVPVTSSTTVSEPVSVRPRFIEPAPEHPATVTGWRAVLANLGLPIGPSRAEVDRAAREKAVSRQWAGCRAIAVANGKGGVGKTMTTAVLSAVFARHGGGNVLAWDNNDTRGTLGWRTEQGDYDTTIRDLLPQARQLLEATASVSDISRYVHHQSIDRYDVLRSNPELLAADQRITTADFDLLAQVAARYYRMVIFDSGNDESADRWLRMIDSAHQLVVPTLAAPESAESAALLLDALRKRDEHSARLAEGAVVIVGQSERSSAAAVQQIAAGFAGHVRAVQVIPFDHSLKAGPIRYDSLQPKTRDAWMQAAAAVAEGL